MMLNTWLALKQTTDAVQQGRLDEALHLALQPAVKAHQRGGELLKQLGLAFLERAKKHLGQGDTVHAWADTQQAAQAGAEPRLVEKLRNETAEGAVKAIRQRLAHGPAQEALDLIADCKRQGLTHPQLQALSETAKAWAETQELANRGEFALALNRLEQTEWRPHAAVAAAHALLLEQQLSFTEKNAELQMAMEERRWRDVIRLADQLLGIAPQYAPVRRARGLAWKELEPPTLVHPGKAAAKEQVKEKLTGGPRSAGGVAVLAAPRAGAAGAEAPPATSLPRRFILWIDGVGGFLVCLSAKASLGQASEGAVDIPLFADISRLHAYISRDSEGYLLEALRPALVNGKPSEKTLLRDGDELTLGTGCKLKFHQPVAITNTARLELKSRHKLPLSLDGVILMDETCLLGDTVDAHIVVPGLRRPIALLRRKEELIAQSGGAFQIDGQATKGRGPLSLSSSISGDDFRITLEPIGPQFGRVRA